MINNHQNINISFYFAQEDFYEAQKSPDPLIALMLQFYLSELSRMGWYASWVSNNGYSLWSILQDFKNAETVELIR